MKVVAEYDFNGGQSAIESKYSDEYSQIVSVITSIDSDLFKTKENHESFTNGNMLFSPTKISKAFEKALTKRGWSSYTVNCDYKHGEYLHGYIPAKEAHAKPFRDMDFVKPGIKLGIDVQFGKNAFMIYSGCAKMTIFSKMGVIDTGIEIVPVKRFADEMSTGVSYFEQFAWDLHHRGESNIDIPVLILGVDA